MHHKAVYGFMAIMLRALSLRCVPLCYQEGVSHFPYVDPTVDVQREED